MLSGFQGMLEQVQQRMHQFRLMEQQLRERVTKLGGTFQIESIEGQGTGICISIPARGVIQG